MDINVIQNWCFENYMDLSIQKLMLFLFLVRIILSTLTTILMTF